MPAFAASFRLRVISALLLVVLGDWMFFQRHLFGGYLGLFALAMVLLLPLGHPGVRRDKRSWIALGAAAIFSLALVYDPSLLAWVLFWTAISMAALLPRTAKFDDGWRWFQRLTFHALRSPLAPLLDWLRLRKARRRVHSNLRQRRPLAPLLALPVIGSLTFLFLFATANPVLAELLFSIRGPNIGALDVLRPFLWAILFTLVWSVIHPRLALNLLPTFDGRGDLELPGVSIASVTLSLVAFNLVFAIQNLMDIVYLWGEARLPGDMTMADYAHRGAYPLIATALLAALFVLTVLRPGSSTANTPAIRWLVMAWVAQNIFLVTSSIERMIDYVGSYSLTELRIVVLGWMVLVAFGLATICWRMLRDRSAGWLININLAAAAALLSAASFVDLGEVVAQWNVRHAREVGGKAVNLDLCYLNELGSSSLLPLIELERNPALTPAYREQVQAVRLEVYGNLAWKFDTGFWSYRDAQRLAKARREIPAMPLSPSFIDRNCDPTPSEPATESTDAPTDAVQPLSTLPPERDVPPDPKVSRQRGPSVR